MKFCKGCNIDREYIDFNKDKREKDGFNSRCRECVNSRRKKTTHEISVSNKLCKNCNITKEPKDFKKQKENTDGLYHICKSCFNIWRKSYRKNSDVKQKESEFRLKNKSYYDEYGRNWKKLNSDKVKVYQDKTNKNRDKEKLKIWRNNNQKNRRENDIIFRMSGNMRNYIRMVISKEYHKSKTSIEIIGCSFIQLKDYLESKFESWMNWDNYGLYNGDLNYGWDIDHIIPLSSAKTEEELLRLNHYTNLQPLCSYTNRHIKRNKHEVSKEI
jgi:hypothetical protein